MIRLQAAAVDRSWEQLAAQELQIHSVYHQVMNLTGKDQMFLSLIRKGYERFPAAVELSSCVDFTGLPARAGQAVQYADGCFLVGDAIAISLEHAKEVLLCPVKSGSCPDRGLIDGMLQLLQIYGVKSELYDALIEQRCQGICQSMFFERLQQLFAMLGEQKTKYDVSAFCRLVGFGVGLTPSGDDFLAGLLLTGRYLGAEWFVKTDWTSFLLYVRQNTGIVSYHMIKNALQGYARESVLQLFEAIRLKRWIQIKELVHKVIAYGSTSGTDMLCGVLSGMKLPDNGSRRK